MHKGVHVWVVGRSVGREERSPSGITDTKGGKKESWTLGRAKLQNVQGSGSG